jgi:iron complex outermembrane recepter protein
VAAFHALGSWVPAYSTYDGVTSLPYANSLVDGQPRWSGDLSGTYTAGPLRTMVDLNYIGSGKYDAQYTGVQFFDNHVASVIYLNSSLQYTFHDNWTVYVNGNNLLNRTPPGIFNYTGGANYDRIGRAYRVGIRVNL